jgi:hypothetical protein
VSDRHLRKDGLQTREQDLDRLFDIADFFDRTKTFGWTAELATQLEALARAIAGGVPKAKGPARPRRS